MLRDCSNLNTGIHQSQPDMLPSTLKLQRLYHGNRGSLAVKHMKANAAHGYFLTM